MPRAWASSALHAPAPTAGGPHETRVWIVDDGGALWLRAGNPTSRWLLAIQRDPTVEVERGGATPIRLVRR